MQFDPAPTHPAFTLVDSQPLPLWQAQGDLYRHETGAQVLSIRCADDNKCFGIFFPTPPDDHTGLPHILEHCVLCGSEKYPVKEPFKELLKSSLQTFLNAMTYPDRTCYPVASRNLADFYNLMDVYLDAVFHPRLKPAVLGQEGWRLQWNEQEQLEIQGVVYNEMKGVYASPEARLEEEATHSILPDTLYAKDYGGDPAHIPELSFEQFEAFHQRWYQPGNAFVGFYGDDDPAARLERLHEALSQVEVQDAAPLPHLQQGWTEVRRVEVGYPADEESDEGIFAQLNWLLPGECSNSDESLIASSVYSLLLHNQASPLRNRLLESGLGEDLTGGPHFHMRQPAFGIGLRGVEPGQEEAVFSLIRSALQDIAREGFRPDLVEGMLNQREFRMREMNSSSRGLGALLSVLGPWMYGADPLDTLQPEPRLAALRERLQSEPGLFQEWIQKHLIDEASSSEVILRPDPLLGEKEAQSEADLISSYEKHFSEDSFALNQAKELEAAVKAFQDTPDAEEDLAKLPTLSLSDLEPPPDLPPLEKEIFAGASLWQTEHDASGIYYLRLAFDLRGLPLEDLALLPLYGRALCELGTERLDMFQFNEQVACHSGGIEPRFETSETYDPDQPLACMMLRIKALKEKIPAALDLLEQMLLEPLLGPPERLQSLLLEEKAGEEGRLIHEGNGFVARRLRAAISSMERASEEMDGVRLLEVYRHWEQQPAESLQQRILEIHRRLIRRTQLCVHQGGDAACLGLARERVEALLHALPSDPALPIQSWPLLDSAQQEGLAMPSPVNFVGLATRFPMGGASPHFSHALARRLLATDFLWERVRMQGGAYGSSASYSHLDGSFVFSSYRDPHSSRTLGLYRESAAWLQSLDISRHSLEQACIGALGSMDPPETPGSRIFRSLMQELMHNSYEQRLQRWEELRSSTLDHIHQFGGLLQDALAQEQRICILGSKATLETEGLHITPVL